MLRDVIRVAGLKIASIYFILSWEYHLQMLFCQLLCKHKAKLFKCWIKYALVESVLIKETIRVCVWSVSSFSVRHTSLQNNVNGGVEPWYTASIEVHRVEGSKNF